MELALILNNHDGDALEIGVGVEGEVSERDERGMSCGGGIVGRPDAQAGAFSGKSLEERDVKLVEFDAGVEAVRELGNDAGSEDGFDIVELISEPESDSSDEQHKERECAEEESVAMQERSQNEKDSEKCLTSSLLTMIAN